MLRQKKFFSSVMRRIVVPGLACLLAATTTHPANAQVKYKGLNTGIMGHLTFEGGFGVTAPAANTQNYANTGWNMLLGGGYKFNKRLSLLAEWNFNDMGVPNDLAYTQSNGQAGSGNEHIWTVGLDPKYNYIRHLQFHAYVIGGGGFSRQLTSFTAAVLVPCGYSGYSGFSGYGGFGGPCVGSVNVNQESSNQGSLNIGTGLEWRFSPYTRYKFFVEGRYLKTYTPNHVLPPGYYASFVPVTLGIRW